MASRLMLAGLVGTLLAWGEPTPASPDQAGEGPRFELRPGESYFRVDGRPAFVLGRNPAGMNPPAYEDHFRAAAAAGERFMRIHFTYVPPSEKAGEIDAGMLLSWDAVPDAAERHGLAVLPVLGVWADWNDGSKGETWHRWDSNPFNVERGGLAQRPAELFDDTPCRRLWLQRLGAFVKRWSTRRAIVGWEVFSELDLVSGAMNGRMLWWQDGYDQFEQADLCRHYQQAAAIAAAFARAVDWSGFGPVPCVLSADLKGAVVGNEEVRLGWCRDGRSEPPDWPQRPLVGQTAAMEVSGAAWQAEFIDPVTGTSSPVRRLDVRDRHLEIALPEFQGSIAVRLRRLDP